MSKHEADSSQLYQTELEDLQQIGDLKIRRLTHDDVADIDKLMKDVVSRLPSRTLFATDDIDYLNAHIEDHGEIYGAWADDRLVAYSVLAFPGSAAKNLGREFGIAEDELHRVAVFDATIVHESVRGGACSDISTDCESSAPEHAASCMYIPPFILKMRPVGEISKLPVSPFNLHVLCMEDIQGIVMPSS